MFRLFNLFSIPVYFHWSTALVFLILLPLKMAVGYVAVLLLILIHEMGHYIAARRNGLVGTAIEIYPFYGLFHCDEITSRRAGLWLYFGGVIAQLIVFAIALVIGIYSSDFLRTAPKYIDAIFNVFVPINLLMVFTNLLPIEPLDGWFIRGLLRREPLPERQPPRPLKPKERQLRVVSRDDHLH